MNEFVICFTPLLMLFAAVISGIWTEHITVKWCADRQVDPESGLDWKIALIRAEDRRSKK